MNQLFYDFFLGCKECVLENPRSFYGSFSLGPFKNSQSLTIANALRRTLFTEISNIAITHVEIEGVLHEYSTILGVRESVLDILLNFKQIILKTSFSGTGTMSRPMYGYLTVRGPGIVRAADLKLPPTIQCVDSDQYIATLSENGNLSLRFIISDFCHTLKQKSEHEQNFLNSQKSTENFNQDGYQNFTKGEKKNERKTSFGNSSFLNSDKEISFNPTVPARGQNPYTSRNGSNLLWVDPNFNPILKVNYHIENLEPIGQNFQNQQIHVEIWTNGSIHPRKALYFTFDFLKNIFHKFDDMKSIHSKLKTEFFQSEETLMKILKSYEYDFAFYNVLNFKKEKGFSDFLEISTDKKTFSKSVPHLTDLRPENKAEEKVLADNGQNDFLSASQIQDIENAERNSFEKNQFLSVKELYLPLRITNCLIQNNLLTIPDLLKFSPKELQNFCGIGNFSLCLIQKKLKKLGFFLKTKKEI
jgi:DNA-directed RNA polymerase alpha subunit